MGALYGKAEVLDRLPAFKVRPAPTASRPGRPRSNRSPARSRPPTTCATSAARTATCRPRRAQAMPASGGASSSPRWSRSPTTSARSSPAHRGARADPGRDDPRITRPGAVAAERVPTVSVSIDGVHPHEAAATLGRQGIFVWDGDFYATGLIEALGQGRDRRGAAARASSTTTPPPRSTALEAVEADRRRLRVTGRPSIQAQLAAASTRPSCVGSSGCGSATRSPRTAATSTA